MFRFLCVYLFVSQRALSLTIPRTILISIKRWAWSIVIPLGYIFWRLIIFENQRKTTDISLQLKGVIDKPIEVIQNIIIYLLKSYANVGFRAWFLQFYQNFNFVNYKFLWVIFVILLVIIAGFHLQMLKE